MSDLLYPLSVYSGTGVVVTFVCTVSPSCTLQYTKVDLFNSCVLLWFTYGKDTIGFSYVFEDLWGIASLRLLVPSPQWH